MNIAQQALETYFEFNELPEKARVEVERGYSIWRGYFRQTLWYDGPFEDEGVELFRLNVRTDLLKNFDGSTEQLDAVGIAMQIPTLSGLVRNERDPSRIQLASSVYVHDENVGGVSAIFFQASMAQMADAANLAELCAKAGLEQDCTKHPSGEQFDDPEDMMGLLLEIRESGSTPSRYLGDEMLRCREECPTPPSVMTNGSQTGITAEFPYMGSTSLLTIRGEAEHPVYLNCAVLKLKVRTDSNVLIALELNERECQENTKFHFLGSWCGEQPGMLSYTTFLTNNFFQPGLISHVLLPAMMLRAHWIACEVGDDDWANGGFELAQENKMRAVGAFVAEEGHRKLGFLQRVSQVLKSKR